MDEKEKLLRLLAEGYRKSKKDTGTNRIARRTRVKPEKIYTGYRRNDGDMERIEAVNQAVEDCKKLGFVTYERNGFSNEIANIYLVDQQIEEVERYLSLHYQYESKRERMADVQRILFAYQGRSPAADMECERLLESLKRNQVPKNYQQTEEVLKALVFIENNQKELYLREASLLIYGSSKYLEKVTLESVCRILRTYRKQPCGEDELPDEILKKYGIIKEKQKISLKGEVTLIKDERVMDIGLFPEGVEFYAHELEGMGTITIRASKLVTVENRTAYLRCQQPDTVFFYLGGYTSRYQRDFLKKAAEDNPSVIWYHFGDIDAGGFYIHEHLCRATGIPFRLLGMSVRELQDARYQSCLQGLTSNDRKRLKALADHELYGEAVRYMLEHGVKLEQEIVSYSALALIFQNI